MAYLQGAWIVLSYFTRIPIGRFVTYSEERYRKGVHFFPFVGLIITALIALPISLLRLPTGILTGALVYLLYLIISGGIHVDGLADTCDGFFSGRGKERILEIMSDPHIGTFGVLAVLLSAVIDMAAFSDIAGPALFFPYVGRSLAYLIASLMPYAKEEGMGKTFVDTARWQIAIVHLLLLCGAMYYAFPYDGTQLLIGLSCGFFGALYVAVSSHRKIGGLTGDTVGCLIELSQTAYLLGLAIAFM